MARLGGGPGGRCGPALRALVLLAALGCGENAPDCFTEDFVLDYYDCCREMQEDGQTSLAAQCFDGQDYTFERCCNYRFGPDVRGLPYTCAWESDGIARLDMGSAGRLRISCTHRAKPRLDHRGVASANASAMPVHTIWMTSWFVARFLVDLEKAVDHCKSTWEEPLGLLQPLLRRPLKVLDVGCGTGMLSAALARAGHEVVAADIDSQALATTRANMRRNKVRGSTLFWDMMTTPSDALLKQRFDVVFAEVSSVAMLAFQQGHPEEDLVSWMGHYYQQALNNLILIDTHMFIFIGVYFRKHPSRLEVITSALMFALAHLGESDFLKRPCEPGSSRLCARAPMISPKHWLWELGIGPPTAHAVIIW